MFKGESRYLHINIGMGETPQTPDQTPTKTTKQTNKNRPQKPPTMNMHKNNNKTLELRKLFILFHTIF